MASIGFKAVCNSLFNTLITLLQQFDSMFYAVCLSVVLNYKTSDWERDAKINK